MPCPCAELYIYHLEGRMDWRTAIGVPDFLGHWQEEEWVQDGIWHTYFGVRLPETS